MSVLDALGFSAYNSISKRASSITTVVGNTLTIGAYGPGSSAGMRAQFGTGDVTGLFLQAKFPLSDTGSTKYIELGVKVGTLPISGRRYRIAHFTNGGTIQATLEINSDGSLSVYRGDAAALLTTTVPVISAGIRYRIGWKLVVDNVAGSTDIQVNEVSKLGGGVGSLNTRGASSNSITEYALLGTQNASGHTMDFDNVVVSSDVFHGEAAVLEDLSTGTGDADNGVPTGDSDSRHCVDDASPDDDSTFTALQNVSDKVLLTFPNLPSAVTVVAAGTLTWAKKSAAGTAKFKRDLKISTTEYLSSNEASPSEGTYAYFLDLSDTSPATASAFTESEVNAMQVGVERSA